MFCILCILLCTYNRSLFSSELASKVMIELLGTYTDENASYAREDAIKCIVTALADPTTFLLDPLLSLKPVRFLEGELIHDLLTIFVSEKLSSYQAFYKNHKEFVHSQGIIFLLVYILIFVLLWQKKMNMFFMDFPYYFFLWNFVGNMCKLLNIQSV